MDTWNSPPPHAAALGQVLLRRGALDEDHLRIALREQAHGGGRLGHWLVSLGFISEHTLRDALGESLGEATLSLTDVQPSAEALAMVPEELARRHQVFPCTLQGGALVLAMANIRDIVALDQVRALLPVNWHLTPRIAAPGEIDRAIDLHYGHGLNIDGILREIETGVAEPLTRGEGRGEYRPPVVRLVDRLIADAVRRTASDIHFEPEQHFLRIRYRVDGLLRQIRALHKSHWPAMAVRLKVMGGMDIAESRAPQDGRCSIKQNGRQVDIRLATQPTLHGENIVLRLLDRQRGLVSLEALGMSEQARASLTRMLERPEGIILVTGPTGSGKTTTLYAMLSHLNRESVNIMTLEDPVEYPLPLVRQTSIGEANRLDFADGVRALMRQDPDMILIGEIRDRDTADMALRAAMTGHQVFSTLHCNSAVGAIPRLLDLGLKAEILAGHICGVIAQRLVRRLCPHCRQARPAKPEELRLLGLNDLSAPAIIFDPVGCVACDGQGYRGRLAIMELLSMDQELDDLLVRRATPRELSSAAQQRGMTSLVADGRQRILQGITSLTELRRVIQMDAS